MLLVFAFCTDVSLDSLWACVSGGKRFKVEVHQAMFATIFLEPCLGHRAS